MKPTIWLAAFGFLAALPQPSRAQSPDANYIGTGTLNLQGRAANPHWSCAPVKNDQRASIHGGQFSMPYSAAGAMLNVTGPVNSDGSITAFASSNAGGVGFKGRVQGTNIIGTATSGGCIYDIQLRQR